MKVVILAGGLGTRLSEETVVKPKPMVEIGGHPILWHIMKHFSHYGYDEFAILCGYKGDIIKQYFLDYHALHSPHLTIHLASGQVEKHQNPIEDWRVHLFDTGLNTNTGGRVGRVQKFLTDAPFFLTYGDGVSNVNLHNLLAFHRAHGKLATITAVRPPSRFGGLAIENAQVSQFIEKPQIGEGWINGGFMVLEPAVLPYIKQDSDSLEVHVLEVLASQGQLMAYQHTDYWQCMDTLREKNTLEHLWNNQQAPWKVWSDA